MKYLVEHGANIHARDNEALIEASYFGHLEVVKYLEERGADIHLIWASENGHLEVVKSFVG